MSVRLGGRVRVLALWCSAVLLPATAIAQPTIYIEPDTLGVDLPGATLTVDVMVADHSDLRAFSIQLFYNQAAIQHTTIQQGNVFTQNGGPGGLFLTSGSNASEGYILADGARIGGGGSSGDMARLFTVNFQAVGPGATNLFFGQILLRDSQNQPIAFESVGGVVAVSSPPPDAAHTRMYDPGGEDEAYVEMGATRAHLRVLDAGPSPRGKVTVAHYDLEPTGGAGSPFEDPDGLLNRLGVAASHWEVTSSLDSAFHMFLALSFTGLDGPKDPADFRVARRNIAATDEDPWALIPLAETTVDLEAERVLIQGPVGTYGAGQYALVFDDPISIESTSEHTERPSLQVYPTPFSHFATVSYLLPVAGPVTLNVYDLNGRRVATVADGWHAAGLHEVPWHPGRLAPGAYFVVLHTDAATVSSRVVAAP